MTASKDSTLFGNDDERTPAQRHDNEHESFSSLPPGAAEPLFPAAPTNATYSWADSLTTSNGSSESNGIVTGNTWAEPDHAPKTYHEPQTHDAVYDWQPGLYPADRNDGAQNDSRDALYSSQDQGTYNNGYNDASTSVGNLGNMAQDWTVEAAHSGHDAHENTQVRGHLDELYAIPAPAEPLAETPAHVAALPTFAEPAPKPVLSERELLFNRHYAVLMDLMQHGAWPQALEKIQAMRAEFPEAALDALLDEATLKTELMERWATKIKGRRLTVGQEWLIRRSLPFFLLLLLFVSGAIFYQTFVAPSRQVVAMERANQALVEEATNLLQVGQIDQAINLYNLVLTRNPEYAPAKQGLLKANGLFGLAVTYDVAIRVANSGNLQRSLVMLQSVKDRSPSFRDIDARIARVESLLAAEKEYILAERAFAQHRWLDAVTHYQNTKALAEDYQAARVLLQLSQSYFMGAQWLMAHWPTPEFGPEQIRDFLRQAQQVNGQDETISAFLDDLERFMKGERSLQNDNLKQAVETWGKLYEEQPAFFGGYLAEQLYRTYLALAADVRAADPDYARELYTLAAEMPVHDSSEARIQLQKLGTVAPAAQPTPTPRPTIAYVAPAVVAPPPATATPVPTATPANTYQGWIAFRTTRAGFEEIYVMRGDGSEQQLATEEVRSRIDSLYQEERRAPDGRMVFVQSANGRSDANIYVVGSDGMNPNMFTDYNGDEYDPVWSPAGDRIVFVSNHTGNDEIWIMRADGGEQRQLTFNNWEWDKHPTWSPDSSQIAFFSNRSGQRQVWVMGTDGSAQRNLSNNNYDDWDPVWIK